MNTREIPCNDKGLKQVLHILFELATRFAFKNTEEECLTFIPDKLDSMYENFLDQVFELEAKLSREEFEQQVIDNASWIFDSSEIRK